MKSPDGESKLLDEEGRMCCLGFYSVACGLQEDQILNIGTPAHVAPLPEEMEWLIDEKGHNSAECNVLMRTNDQRDDNDRERLIAFYFDLRDIAVTFKD